MSRGWRAYFAVVAVVLLAIAGGGIWSYTQRQADVVVDAPHSVGPPSPRPPRQMTADDYEELFKQSQVGGKYEPQYSKGGAFVPPFPKR